MVGAVVGMAVGAVTGQGMAWRCRSRTLPIANCDGMDTAEIVAELDALTADEIEQLVAYEVEHKNRRRWVEELDRRLRGRQRGRSVGYGLIRLDLAPLAVGGHLAGIHGRPASLPGVTVWPGRPVRAGLVRGARSGRPGLD